jgi:aspartyl-tRNA(Asn)/glutamyl-tRNA(Gln) amidotransferase subunit C
MAQVYIDVPYVAELARLRLTPEETETFQRQLAEILAYVAKLQELDVSDVPLDGEEESFQNRLRLDREEVGLSQEDVLGNAPKKDNSLFLVPKIVE